jgi:hypothetical protein
MYKTVLVREMIEDGSRLLQKLDERGIPVSAAAWFDDPDQSAWKLVIVPRWLAIQVRWKPICRFNLR